MTTVELWKCNPVELVEEIISNPALDGKIHYEPIRTFSDTDKNEHIYNEAHTGEWWWNIQSKLPQGATVAAIIITSDATRLSQFGGDKTAWSVYISLANVEKHIRWQPRHCAMLLLGYLPVSKLECFTEVGRRTAKQQLFHCCMRSLLAPLVEAGQNGVKMTCADGNVRSVHPILAVYIADHPEQCLVACSQENRCPQCLVHHNHRGQPLDDPEINSCP
ncbi:hypothetical protein Clacol_007984 [Clathrus columnatus]|uniref:Uncharacterized protein n=1 Tax=Clathrus columnatus TaxID=1419009 RepID=A0AAV5AJR0_9AGAM|nr:hypothetical protein Clacol_007984 [Clathrus columnatus]